MRYDDLQGIIPPMVTPFTEAGELDEELHRADVRFLIDQAGVHGLAVCTSTGEGYTLSAEECRTVTRWTVEEAAGAVPVIAGVIADSTHAAIRRARAVADLGIKALLVPPVHYVYQPDDDSTLKFFADIAEASGTAVIIDNVVPWFYLSPDLLSRILQDVSGVIGVKQSANDLKALADLLWLIDEKGIRTSPRIFSAVNPLLYPSFMLGAHGAIAAINTASPEWSVKLWNATRASDQSEALAIHNRLLSMWGALEGENLPANVKGAMWLQKRKAGFPRAPIPMSPPARRGKIRAALGLR
jgi:4-hydroxy-tetrahydrodipicolinate synthase